jgi:hypothetical protein
MTTDIVYDVLNMKKNRTLGHNIFSESYFIGLSLRNTSKALPRFVKINLTAIRYWIQKYKPEMLSSRKIRITEFIIDETCRLLRLLPSILHMRKVL